MVNLKQERRFKENGKVYFLLPCAYCDEYIKIPHGQKKYWDTCPHCKVKSPYILKPRTERELFELQNLYLVNIDEVLFNEYAIEIKKAKSERNEEIIKAHEDNMDKQILEKMWILVEEYTGSLMKKMMKKKGFYLENSEFVDRVRQAVFFWYDQFTKKPGFKIEESWAGQLRKKIIQALYSHKHEEMNSSLNDIVHNYKGKETEVIDLLDNFDATLVYGNLSYDPYEESIDLPYEITKILHLIEKHIRKMNSKKELRNFQLSLIGFQHYLNKNTFKLQKLYELFGNDIKRNVESLKLFVRKYLRDILCS